MQDTVSSGKRFGGVPIVEHVQLRGDLMAAQTPYETLVASASQLVETDAIRDFEGCDFSAARELVERNRPAMEAARRALGQRCAVPLRYDSLFLSAHLEDIQHLRNLARAFRLELLCAAASADFDRATRIGIDLFELANAVRRGALIVDMYIGVTIADSAIDLLRKIRPWLDDVSRSTLMAALQRLEDEREPFDVIAERDQRFELAVDGDVDAPSVPSPESPVEIPEGVPKEFFNAIIQGVQQLAAQPASVLQEMHRNTDLQSLALPRLLRIDLALRSWYSSHGSFPADLRCLAPTFLAELPVDPYTDAPFIYRPVGEDWFLLYSTGPKRMDGGGEFGSRPAVAAGNADLCLDAEDYAEDMSLAACLDRLNRLVEGTATRGFDASNHGDGDRG